MDGKLKVQVRISHLPPLEDCSGDELGLLKHYEAILLDTNVLNRIAYEGCRLLQPLINLMYNWRTVKPTAVCCVCDFIRIESLNVERWEFGDTRVRRLLKEVAENENGLYVELKTPIKEVIADQRKRFIDLFPKAYRHVLIKKYGDLSGTDVCLLIIALYLAMYGASASIATFDKTLLMACDEFGIKTFLKNRLREGFINP